MESLALYPKYIHKGLKTQLNNVLELSISKKEKRCFVTLYVISKHILRADSTCFASDFTLMKEVNEELAAKNLPIAKSNKTFHNDLKMLEKAHKVIHRDPLKYDHETGQKKRHITIVCENLKNYAQSAFNWMMQAVDKRLARENNTLISQKKRVENALKDEEFLSKNQKLHSRGVEDINNLNPLDYSGLAVWSDEQNYTRNANKLKDQTYNNKEAKNKKFSIPSDLYFYKNFGQYAEEIKETQLAAKNEELLPHQARSYLDIMKELGKSIPQGFCKFLKEIAAGGMCRNYRAAWE